MNQTAQGCAATGFGIGALMPDLIPLLLLSGLLVIYGLLLLDMALLLSRLRRLTPA